MDEKVFKDKNLILRIYAILNTYKYRHSTRKFIMSLLDSAINSQETLTEIEHFFESIGKDIF